VFRYLDDRSHWQLTSSTRYATWVLEHIVEGEVVFRSDTGLSTVADGTSIAVSFQGDEVVLFVNGVQLLAAIEEKQARGAGLGLLVTEREPGRARFDDLAQQSPRPRSAPRLHRRAGGLGGSSTWPPLEGPAPCGSTAGTGSTEARRLPSAGRVDP